MYKLCDKQPGYLTCQDQGGAACGSLKQVGRSSKGTPRDSPTRLCRLPPWCIRPSKGLMIRPLLGAYGKRNLKRIKRKVKVCVSGEGRAVLWTTIWLCLRLCPWYFQCIVMYAWYKCHCVVGTRTRIASQAFDELDRPAVE